MIRIVVIAGVIVVLAGPTFAQPTGASPAKANNDTDTLRPDSPGMKELIDGLKAAGAVGPEPTPGPSRTGLTRPDGQPSRITNPEWETQPSTADLNMVYPRLALRLGIDGVATLHCTVDVTGDLTGCAPILEQPKGFEFGAAAMRLVPRMKMRPQTRDGVPLGGAAVNSPLNFNPM